MTWTKTTMTSPVVSYQWCWRGNYTLRKNQQISLAKQFTFSLWLVDSVHMQLRAAGCWTFPRKMSTFFLFKSQWNLLIDSLIYEWRVVLLRVRQHWLWDLVTQCISNKINNMKGIQPKRENLYVFISCSTNNWLSSHKQVVDYWLILKGTTDANLAFFFLIHGWWCIHSWSLWVLLKIFWINRTNPVPSVTERKKKKMPNLLQSRVHTVFIELHNTLIFK